MSAFRNPIAAGLKLIREALQSTIYTPGVAGWSINRDGSAEFQDVTARGDLFVNSLTAEDAGTGGKVVIDPSTFGAIETNISLTPGNPFGNEEDAVLSAENQLPGQVPVTTLTSPAEQFGAHAQLTLQGQPSGGGTTSAALFADDVLLQGATTVFGDLTVNGFIIGQFLAVVKASDETVTSSTVLQNDDELFLNNLVAGATYLFDGYIKYTGATGAAGIKNDFTIPIGATFMYTRDAYQADAGGIGSVDTTDLVSTDQATIRQLGTFGIGTDVSMLLKGTLIMGGNAGTLRFRWAQFVSNATGVTVRAGSWLRLHRVG